MAARNSEFTLIDYRLSDTELESFEAWLSREKPEPQEVFAELAAKGYKVSFTYVGNSGAWCISVTGQKEAKRNAERTLTTWGDDPLETLYMALFKITVVFDNGNWKTKTQSRRG